MSSSMMETMRVMSLDQKSRFLMLGPCSSGGTAFDWTEREKKCLQIRILKNMSVLRKLPKSKDTVGLGVYI